MKHSVYENTTK